MNAVVLVRVTLDHLIDKKQIELSAMPVRTPRTQRSLTDRLDDVMDNVVNVLADDGLALVDDDTLAGRLLNLVLDGVQAKELRLVLLGGGVRLCKRSARSIAGFHRETRPEHTLDLRLGDDLLLNDLLSVVLVCCRPR